MVDYSAQINNTSPRFFELFLAYKENPRLFADVVYSFLSRELISEREKRGYDIQRAANELGINFLQLKMMENGDHRFSFINYINLLDSYEKVKPQNSEFYNTELSNLGYGTEVAISVDLNNT